MNTKEKEVVFVGVDVSKENLDVYRPDTGENIKIQNTEVDINGLCMVLQKKKMLVAMEATGGYETLLVKCLAKHGIDAAVLNPRQVRDFAKGMGLDAKTDPIDAKVISKFAALVKPQAMAMTSDHEQKHSALVTRRSQLLELINQENNRLKQSWDDDVKKSIREVLESLKKQLKNLDPRSTDGTDRKNGNRKLTIFAIQLLPTIKTVAGVMSFSG